MFQGTSHLFRKFGFFWIDSAPLGMSMSNTVATLSLVAVMCFVTEEGGIRFGEGRPLLLILVGGVFNAIAALFFWTSLVRQSFQLSCGLVEEPEVVAEPRGAVGAQPFAL